MTVNPANVFDSSIAAAAASELPPLTAAIRHVWPDATRASAQVGAVASGDAIRAFLNAVYGLELRVLALEGTPFSP
jgi:hypothetical protein